MEKIKLSTSLARAVWKEIQKKGYKPRINLAGFYDEKFTQEELDLVRGLELVDYWDELKDIKYLRNLKSLTIKSTQFSEYTAKRDLKCLSDQDIFAIEKLENLEHLTIDNQREISQLDISGFKNLQTLEITRCENLREIVGLTENRTLTELRMYGLNSITKIKDLDKFIEKNQNLANLELDVLFYPSAIGFKRNGDFNQNASDILESLDYNIIWSESVTTKKTSINHFQMKKMHKKAFEIIKRYSIDRMMDMEKVVAVNEYIARNIKYNYSALDTSFRGIVKNGIASGPSKGVNGAYDGLINNTCVCEGYTRVMQYLLTLVDVKTANTYCIAGKDNYGFAEKKNEALIRLVSLPNDGFHSICRIERDSGIYYCDSCWNAGRYQKGDTSMPWLLLTKGQIADTHTLSYNEQNVSHQQPIPSNYIQSAKQNVLRSFQSNLEM